MTKLARWTMMCAFTATALLIGWNTTPRVTSQSPALNGRGEPNRKVKPANVAIDKWAKKSFDLLDLGKAEEDSLFVSDNDQELDGDEDPDLPPWMAGKIDKGTYLSLRGDNIDMLRGRPYNFSYDPRESAIAEMDRQESLLKRRLGAVPAWTALGPSPIPNGQTSDVSAPVSGRTIAIAVHPTDPDTVYVGTANGGIWKSTNGGTNWTSLFDLQLQSMAIGAITIDPTDTNIIYVGTGENGFSADSFAGVGLYIIRAANSASPTLNGPFRLDGTGADVFSGRAIGRILVNPSDNNTIFVCTASGTAGNPNVGPFLIPNRGIFRSTNAQSAAPTFAKVAITGTGGVDRNVVDMAMDPGDPNLVIATVVGASADGGIYRTPDALSATPTFTRTRTLPDGATNGRAELAINRNASVVTVYAAVGQTSTIALGGPANCAATRSGYVTRSVDGGLTWSTPLPGSTGFCGGQCFYDIAIAATQDNQTIHLGGAARGGAGTCLIDVMKRSTNGGTSFARNDTSLHADEHALAIAPSNQSVVYTSSDGGIWRSTDNGTTWVSKNNIGFSATQFQSLSVHPFDRYFTIGGTQDNGTNCLSPNGVTWTNCRGGDGGYTLIDTNALDTSTLTMYHTFFNQPNNQIAFERADDTGFAWNFRGCSGVSSNNGMTCADTTLFYAPMEQGPGNPNTIYFGTDRLYRSTNRGDLMTLASQAPIVAGQPVTTIGISPQNDNVRIVGLRNGTVWATTTGSAALTNVTGANFPPANPNDPTRKPIGRAVIDPNNPNTAYVTFTHYFDGTVPLDQHVFKTTNLNNPTPTWTAAGNGIPNIPVSAFFIDPQDSNHLFAGTDIGVYESTNGGGVWTPFGTGLPRAPVFDMDISNVHRVLRIATHGRGLFEIDIPGQKLPIIRAGGNGGTGPGGASALVAESCAPNNGAIDSGELVTISFSIKNIGGGPTSNLVATLQPTGGVMLSAGPQVQSYGAIPAGGTVTKNFTFTATGTCNQTLTPTIQLQDGAINYGTLSVVYTLGALVTSVTSSENFDGVVAPALPAGWATAQTGAAPLWATTTAFSDTAPNSAATDGSDVPGDNSLTSPTFAIPTAPGVGVSPGVRLSFRNYFNTEGGFDGGVLEISINGGAFADILTAGGSFISGGYTTTIGPTDSVLTGRQAWSGNSNGFITTTVLLPAASYGQNAQFRWRTAYDTGTNPAGGGMRVDTFSIFTATRVCCGTPTAAPASIGGKVTTTDGAPVAGVTMNLGGARTARAITDSNGDYRFSNVDTANFYTVTPALTNYHFGPESRSISLLANVTDAGFTASPDAIATGNAIDSAGFFVRQHYLDFLGREPDESGFNFWTDQILSCGSDAACAERRTINVSAAYFLSIEFQQTGGLVDGLYRASYGRRPNFAEFIPDAATVAHGVRVGDPDWAGTLSANKEAFAAAWVERPAFQAAYGGLNNGDFVDTLISHTGGNFNGDREALVGGLNSGALTRAQALRQIAENDGFVRAKRNETFVMMQYFGYLRRDPDAAGYNFWLNKLNQFNGNFEQAEMVKAFLVSGEYRGRFSH